MGIGKIDPDFAIREGWARDQEDEVSFDGYNAFLQITTSDGTTGFSVLNSVGGTAFKAKSDGDGYVARNLGVGTENPVEKLEVIGVTKTDGLQVTQNPVSGYVLTSDNDGVATWQPASGGVSEQTFQEFKSQQGDINNTILKDLDGYVVEQTFQENKNAQNQINQFVLESLDGYALDSNLQGLNQTVEEKFNQQGQINNTIIDELDGYTPNQTFEENKNQQSQVNQTILSALDGYADSDNGFTLFSIWAEEGGGLSNNNRQWSFGNGATGNINIVIPFDCELFAGSLDALTSGTSVSIDFIKNDSQVVATPNFVGAEDFSIFSTPISFSAGDRIGFRTNSEIGAYANVRVASWFRVKASPASTSVLNDLLDVDTGGVEVGNFLQFDGNRFVPAVVDFDGYITGIEVKKDGVTQNNSANVFNFIGSSVSLATVGGNQINITVDAVSEQTFQEFKSGQSEINNDILSSLDGYALDTDLQGLNQTFEENKNQQSQINQTIIGELDGYAVLSDYQYEESLVTSSTTSTTFQDKVTLTTPSLTGTYRVGWRCNVESDGVLAEIRLFNSTDSVEIDLSSGESGGGPISPGFYVYSGFARVVFTGSSKAFIVQWRRVAGGPAGSVLIRNAKIEFWKVAA